MSKQLSGAQKRKIKKQKLEEIKSVSQKLEKWLRKDTSEVGEGSSNKSSNKLQDNIVVRQLDLDYISSDSIASHQSAITTQDNEKEQNLSSVVINYNDPHSWPVITNHLINCLVKHGVEQGDNINFNNLASDNLGRKFTKDWFNVQQINGETVKRKWLLYSVNQNAIFCFPCMLFGHKSNAISDPHKGFHDWKHLHPMIPQHENSSEHRNNYVKWKVMEKNLISGAAVYDYLLNSINKEAMVWREILKIIVDAILFCAKNNIGLRGSNEKIGDPNCGIFLNLIEFVSHYNNTLKDRIEKHKKGSVSYFSPAIQNEIINLIGDKIRNQIISRIKKAKYYAILFDCTPDLSKKEQMSQVIRYVYINSNGKVTIEESFIDFIESHEKTGEGLATEILNKITDDKLDILDARGQGYDNGANMSGKYKGVRARILEINNLALYVPCMAHNLNLVCVHAASVTPEMITFFGTVQRLFNFFSSSTTRWEFLMKSLKLTLKSSSDTRWSSKANAIKSLNLHLFDVKKALESIAYGSTASNPETVSSAKSLLFLIDYKFICHLSIWNKIIQCIDRTNTALQRKDISIDHGAKLIDGLRCTLQELRETGFEQNFEESNNLAKSMEVDIWFRNKRMRKVKRMEINEAPDEGSSMTHEELFKMQMCNVFDTLLSQLKWRYEQLRNICNDFSFLKGSSLKNNSVSELKKAADELSFKYSMDLNRYELSCEIESLKFEASILVDDLETAIPLDILQGLHDYGLIESYPNINIAIRLFLTLPVSIASCERSFSKLKLIKNYLRSTIGQDRLSNIGIISIEYDIAKDINYDNIIDEFAQIKARKVRLNKN